MKELIKSRKQHGGNIYSDFENKGKLYKNILDLSSNINPMPLPKKVYDSLGEILDKAKAYPDIEYRELKRCIAKYLNKMLGNNLEEDIINISLEDLVLGNGAVEIIDKTIASFDHIIIPRPSFIEYKLSALRYGKDITFIDRDMFKDISRDDNIIGLDFINKIIENVRHENSLVVICNPNNPDGAIYDIEAMKYLLEELMKKKSFLLVDETFSEFIGDINKNALTLINAYDNLIIVKALTKFFGLPGVRLGYGITKNRELVENIIIKQTTWNIGAFAENIAKIMLEDDGYIKKSIIENNKNRRTLKNILEGTYIFERVYNSYGDFFTVILSDLVNPKEFEDYLKNRGILVRSLKDMEPFNERAFRIAIKDSKAISRFNRAIAEFSDTLIPF